jgi:hypothetical protein
MACRIAFGEPVQLAQNVQRVAHRPAFRPELSTDKPLNVIRLSKTPVLACGMQFAKVPAELWARPGCHLTTLFGNHAVSTVSVTDTSAAPKKHGWLPLLTMLFLISYGLMTMLIVEQGRTIESQRALIRELFHDSTELSSMKMRGQQHAQLPSARTQAPMAQTPTAQVPSTPYSSTPNSQAPSSQAGPQHRAPNAAATQKPQFRKPSKPAADLVDDCRTLITI